MPMANKKKIATSVAAVAMAAAMLLGGTFAWQSISQTALNEASDIVNPGGRLHDDFNGENKDVYVENFADEPIFARVRLGEYMEIVVNKGMDGLEKTVAVIGSIKEDTGEYNYETFKDYDGVGTSDGDNDGMFASAAVDTEGNPYWTWTTGGETVYMPTFNLNKDSLEADVNGTYEGPDGVRGENPANNDIDDKYEDYHGYTDGETEEGLEIYDADSNNIDEVGDNFDNLTQYEIAGNIVTISADEDGDPISHTAKPTGTAQLISMAEWLAMNPDAAAMTAADDPYGIAPAFAQNETAILHYDKNADDAAGAITDVTEPYGSLLTLSDGSGFTREGYTLVGWNTQPDGSGETYALGKADWMLPEGETTLYAVWELDDGTGGGTDDENTQDDEPAYWVYDEDGWVYYSKPIQPHTATGLLLSGIKLNEVMDDSWYYAIQVTGQFITADDLGSMEDGTGFYDTDKGTPPSENAKKLLKAIGVEVPEDGTTGDEGGEVGYLHNIVTENETGMTMTPTENPTLFVQTIDGSEKVDNVTWSTDSAELVIDADGKVSFNGELSKTMQSYIVKASLDGEVIAEEVMCVYNPEQHSYHPVFISDDSNYYVFKHLKEGGIEDGYCIVLNGEIVTKMSDSNTDEDVVSAIRDGTFDDLSSFCPWTGETDENL